VRSLYLIGAPGVGKTTLMAALTAPLGEPEVVATPVPHLKWREVVEVGRRRGEFSGTDALGYAVVPSAVAWVRSERRPAWLLGEGDRLACRPFLDALRAAGDLDVVLLDAPRLVSYARMCDRAARLGREPQTEAWWKGRVTKCARLADEYDAIVLDGRAPVSVLRDTLRELLTFT